MLRGHSAAAACNKREQESSLLVRAQGLGTDIPLSHAAHSLSLECPSQINRPAAAFKVGAGQARLRPPLKTERQAVSLAGAALPEAGGPMA